MKSNDVQRIRKKLKLSQSEFAELIGVSTGSVQDWEQGRHAPRGSAVAMLKLADAGTLTPPPKRKA